MDMRPLYMGMSSEWVHVHLRNNAIFLLHMIDFSECHGWPFSPVSVYLLGEVEVTLCRVGRTALSGCGEVSLHVQCVLE